ncbi:uncharacterized protein DUF3223 [Pseudomonas duriflava]|uniref:Uncharacterized protein DUF3223 n=1 Tax=Pseudomonas duriflava TaxID=459528 RepID=A0A562PJR1_9PSED|nr:DCL family protein [Pseudomonas duriflava]TWI44618.1 uncharacterized protein DUF3223 [Pseudomonas duriflava]
MAKAITLSNGRTWKTQKDALAHFKAMLDRYDNQDVIDTRADHEDLVVLLERYDEAITDGPSKTGTGIDYFTRTLNNFKGFATAGFWVHREDGTATDFSYISAVKGQPKGPSKEFYDACRAAVQEDLHAAKLKFFKEYADTDGYVPCEVTGQQIAYQDAHLDHAGHTFNQIVSSFRAARGWTLEVPNGIVSLPADGQTQSTLIDPAVAKAFVDFHHSLATLRIVLSTVNLSMAARQRQPTIRRPVPLQCSSNPA